MNDAEKIQRNSNDILITLTDEEELFRKKFKQDLSTDCKCTICDKKIKEFYPHPALGVLVCPDCFQFYNNAVFLSNKDGTDKNCRWCAKLSQKYLCTYCTVVFCPDCLNRNFQSNYVNVHVTNNPEWKCMICNQKQLWALRAQCATAHIKTDVRLNQSKARVQRAGEDEEESSDNASDPDEIPDHLNKQLTAEEMTEARGIFEPSRKNFDRLIDKIKVHCRIFSAVTANRELRNAKDVLELTKKVSCMCRCIQDVITWIDGCNKSAYKDWFNKNISNISGIENTQNSARSEFNESNDTSSVDLTADVTKASRKTKTKDVLQSLRLKKTKEESQEASGVSENFMSFLQEVQVEIKKELLPDDINIKSEKSSVFSKNTLALGDDTSPKQINEGDSKSVSTTRNCDLELQNRLLSDFDDENIRLKTVEYLCDKTGDVFEGFEPTSSGNTTPIIFKEEQLLSDEEENENVEDFFEISKSEENGENDEIKEEIFSYSPELMKLLNIDDNHEDDVDSEIRNEAEEEIDMVYKYLANSDCSSFSSLSSFDENEEDRSPIPEINEGRIQTLDIANELHKLRSNLSVIEDNNLSKNIMKTCEVRLVQLDFSKLAKIPGFKYRYEVVPEYTAKPESPDLSDTSTESLNLLDSDNEVNTLLNLKSLTKRKRHNSNSSSSSSSTSSEVVTSRGKRSTKRKRMCETSSTDEYQNEESSDDLLSDYEIPKDEPRKTGHENILNDLDSKSDVLNEISGVNSSSEESEDKNTTVKKEENEESDEDNKTKKKKCKDKNKIIPAWKKDTLLTGRLTSDKNTSTSNSNKNEVNDEFLKQEETKYLEKTENKSLIKTKKNEDDDEDAIILSDNISESEQETETDTDSDIIFIPNKRKKGDDTSPNEKGRKNIRKVLNDDELQAETQIAHLEEEKRKERITIKNRSIDAVLSQSSLSEEDISLVLDVDETTKIPLVKIPQVLVNPLKPHQITGIKFMWDICFESVNQMKSTPGTGCILAHCMGLGKTMQIVVLTYTLLTYKVTGLKHVLILCPLSTVFNWCNEFRETLKNAPETINVFDLRSDKYRSFLNRVFEIKKWRNTGGVLIMGYDSFTSLVNEKKLKERVTAQYQKTVLESLINPGPDLVVCDEGHILKSSKTHKFKAINRVRTKRRIILTGTPLQNNLKEYWHMVSFVKPHLLGTYKEYSNRFVNPIVNGQYEDSSPMDIQIMKRRSHVLHKKLRTTVNRYELSELKQYLPPKHEYVLFIQLSELQIKLYKLYLEKIGCMNRNLFQNFHDLQNIWTHPALLHHKFEKRKTYDEDFDPNLDPDTVNSQHSESTLNVNWYKDHIPSDVSSNINYGSKIVILFSIIQETCAIGDKLLVFSSSIQELDLIEEILKSNENIWTKNVDYYRMDGSVLPEKRMQYCNAFNEKNNKRAKLFLISHKVGGLGLNLIAANRVVLMDVNWNPAYDTQSVFRVYRFGQQKPCFIYRLVSLGTMEELVYSRAVTKLAISCRVVDEQQIRRHFKENDQHKLYKLNTDYLNQEPVTPNLPSDRLLANLWGKHKPVLYNFKDHQSMLENLTHEELNEEEMKIAWDEFNREDELEKARLLQLANTREFYKQYQAMTSDALLKNPFNQVTSNTNYSRGINTAQPIDLNPEPSTSTGSNTRPIFLNAHTITSNILTTQPSISNSTYARPTTSTVSNIGAPKIRAPIANVPIPHPVLIHNNETFQIATNPFNQAQKNNELIVPDVITNYIPAHSTSLTSVLPTAPTQLPPPNSAYNSFKKTKKVYNNPGINLPIKQQMPKLLPATVRTQDGNKQKKAPQLLPTNLRNQDIQFLAKNGVRISPTKKNNNSAGNQDIVALETIDLE